MPSGRALRQYLSCSSRLGRRALCKRMAVGVGYQLDENLPGGDQEPVLWDCTFPSIPVSRMSEVGTGTWKPNSSLL